MEAAAPAAPEPSLPPSRRLEAAGAAEPAEAGAPPEEGEPSEALPLPVLRKRIRYIFEQRNKEHLSKLPRMMTKNAGSEQAFYDNLLKKHELDESFFPLELGLTTVTLAERIQYIFEQKAPKNLGKLQRMMSKNAGKELAFLRNLMAKHGLDESFFPTELALARPGLAVYKARIAMIFEHKDREHLDALPRMFHKNKGQEETFYRNLLKKHGLDESFFAAVPEGVPPLPAGSFAYQKPGAEADGVVSVAEAELLVLQGVLTADSMVAGGGMPRWRPLIDVKDALGMGAVFDVADEDLVGELTEDEALEACAEMGIAARRGEVTLAEMQAALRSHLSEMKRNPKAVFEELDADNSGTLSRGEVKHAAAMLGFLMNKQQAEDAFAQMDGDGNGSISFDEFETWFRVNVQASQVFLSYRSGEGGEGVHVSVEQAEVLVLKGEIGPDTLVQTQQSTEWRTLRDAKDELGMGAVFDVAEEDLVGELTEDEALEACGEVGIAVTKGEATLGEMQAALRSHLSEMKRNPKAVFEELDADNSGSCSCLGVSRMTLCYKTRYSLRCRGRRSVGLRAALRRRAKTDRRLRRDGCDRAEGLPTAGGRHRERDDRS